MVLFNSARPTDQMREIMENGDYRELEFWIGLVLIWSIAITGVTQMATFTAWRMVSSVSEANTHTVLRSSIGLFVCQFPSRLVVMSLYSFFLWFCMFVVRMVANPFSMVILGVIAVIFIQMTTVYSAFGRIILNTGAMGKEPILDPDFERSLLSSGLHASLLIMAASGAKRKSSVDAHYRSPSKTKGASRMSAEQDNSKDIEIPRTPRHKVTIEGPPAGESPVSKNLGAASADTLEDPHSTPSTASTSLSSPIKWEDAKEQLEEDTHQRRKRPSQLELEWNNESDVRATYGMPPPAQLSDLDKQRGSILPRASFLNQTFRLSSLRNLARAASIDDGLHQSLSIIADSSQSELSWYGASLPPKTNSSEMALETTPMKGDESKKSQSWSNDETNRADCETPLLGKRA